MNIAVFGATGGTGKAFVQQALTKGHEINALVRTPGKIEEIQSPHLHLIEGDVLNSEAVANTIRDAEVVVVSLGTTSNNPDNVVSEGTRLIIEQMQHQHIGRLLVVTSIGVGDSKDQVPFFFKMLMKTVLKKVMADKNIQEQYVRESGL
ncbi:MAG: NAD(P)H-binding protein, partial [Anaerolineales bacterium]|nr:NAD(P)H-binding protein [Anaerolineales bacterium]